MKLTVGPLPAAVYWRRRAVVIGVLLIAIVMFWTSCSRDPKSGASRQTPKPSGGTSTSASASPEPSSTMQTPTVPSPSAEPTLAPPTTPPAIAAECPDTALLLTADPAVSSLPSGAYLQMTLRVKNISATACNRDLGANLQELYLQLGTTKVWSSDVCATRGTPSSVKTMEPSIEHSFSVTWDGKANAAGCTNRAAPAPGRYQLFARLGTKISDPAAVQLT